MEAEAINGKARILVNCAGIGPPAKVLNEDGAHGVIGNTASVAAFDGQFGQPVYAASK